MESENEAILHELHRTQEQLEEELLRTERLERQLLKSRRETNDSRSSKDAKDDKTKSAIEKVERRIQSLENDVNRLTAERDHYLNRTRDLKLKIEACIKERNAILESLETEKKNATKRLGATERLYGKVLHNLHMMQEEVDDLLDLNDSLKNRSAVQQKRLERLKTLYPRCWEFSEVRITPVRTINESTVEWHFTEVHLADEFLPELRFLTELNGSFTGITFLRPNIDSPFPLLRWPKNHQQELALPCILKGNAFTTESKVTISSLSQRDWKILNELVSKLIDFLLEPPKVSLPRSLDTKRLSSGLNQFQCVLQRLPKVLRYSGVAIQDIENSEEYKRLSITLKDVSLAGYNWTCVEYILSTVDKPSEPFGRNPRLEFLEHTKHGLKKWFAETKDEKGNRLELRFAYPNLMDTPVWTQLDEQDQILIAGLIATLPLQIEEAHSEPTGLDTDLDAWISAAEFVKSTFTMEIKSLLFA